MPGDASMLLAGLKSLDMSLYVAARHTAAWTGTLVLSSIVEGREATKRMWRTRCIARGYDVSKQYGEPGLPKCSKTLHQVDANIPYLIGPKRLHNPA